MVIVERSSTETASTATREVTLDPIDLLANDGPENARKRHATGNAFDIPLGVNKLWPGEKLPPGDKRWGQYTRSFHPERHTPESFAKLISDGHAFCPVIKGSHRLKGNFITAQHLVLDFDNGDETSAISTLLADPFIERYAALVYSTLSSTPEAPRSRVVFILSEPIIDMATADKVMRAMVEKFPTSDQTVGEASRFLYGSRPDGTVILLGNILDLEIAESLVGLHPEVRSVATTGADGEIKRPYSGPPIVSDYTVLDLITQYVPRPYRTNNNPRSKYTMWCPFCPNPLPGEDQSFTVAEDNNLWRCSLPVRPRATPERFYGSWEACPAGIAATQPKRPDYDPGSDPGRMDESDYDDDRQDKDGQDSEWLTWEEIEAANAFDPTKATPENWNSSPAALEGVVKIAWTKEPSPGSGR